MAGGRGGEPMEIAAVPKAASDAVTGTLAAVGDLQSQLHQLLSLVDEDVIAELPPLRRARTFLVLAQATSALFYVRLKSSGIQAEDHAVVKEFERLSMYRERLDRLDDWSKAPLRPSARLNSQAATRFIGHSLPDLTPEQRKDLRDISRGDFVRGRITGNHNAKRKRKHKPERQSARDAAKEFLEKAARELLGASEIGVKGPLQDISEEEDELVT